MKKSSDIRDFFVKKSNEGECSSIGSESQSSSTQIESVTEKPSKDDFCDLGSIETGPSRPILESYPATDFSDCKRSFSSRYFEKFEWIEYSEIKDSVFCFTCRVFPSGSKEDLLTVKGLKNWKKLGNKLQKHAVSASHLLSMAKWISYRKPSSSETILHQLSSSHKKEVLDNRDYFKKNLDILLFLARQGMPLRGHDESKDSSNRGNYLELMDLFSKYDENFKNKFEKYFNLTSHNIQNEILETVAEEILSKITSEVNEAGYFSLMVDEAKSHKTQELCICVRYMKGFNLKERLIATKDVSLSRTANSLANEVLPFLREMSFKAILVGQSYDGASVMSGNINGLQTLIRKDHPFAMYVHCLAHRVNLVLVEACKSNDYSCSFFNVMQSLYVYFSHPDSQSELKKLQNELDIKTPGPHEIHSLSDTRWSCRATAVLSVKRNFPAILGVLNSKSEDLRHPKSCEAKGLLSSLKSIGFIVPLIVFADYLVIVNVLSKALQRSDSCFAECANIAQGVIKEFETQRSEDSWEEKWEDVKRFCTSQELNLFPSSENKGSNQSPDRKRPRKMSKKLDSYFVLSSIGQSCSENLMEGNDSLEKSYKLKFRRNFFYPVLDTFIEELKRRFSGESLEIASSSEYFLRLDDEKSKIFIQSYSIPGIQKDFLKAEMLILRNVFENSGVKYKDTPLKELMNALKEEVFQSNSYPNFKKLLKVSLTLPCNSATCERSFSSMRRINNQLRCSMSQDRLSDLMILFSESDLVKDLDYDKLADRWFCKTKHRKLILQ